MKKIEIFVASDGTRFDKEEGCRLYEEMITKTNKVLEQLPAENKDITFQNGHGYIQHSLDIFEKVRMELLDLIKSNFPHEWVDKTIEGMKDPSWIGRLLCDASYSKPLYNAWCRIMNTDSDYREWGQYYFKLNGCGEMKQLNK